MANSDYLNLLERVRSLEALVGTLVQRGELVSTDEQDQSNPNYAVSAYAGVTDTEMERVQDYGFASRPLPGAETVTLWLNGRRDAALILAAGDRRYRLTLNEGEVALYTDEDQKDGGHRVVLKRGQIVELRGRELDAEFSERIRLATDGELELHAGTRREMDVAGYGEALNFDGTVWTRDSYHDGAVFGDAVEHGIEPPEVD